VDKPKVTKTVVIYSGRFQPFHKGHYAAYEKLVSKFGKNNVYIATSNKTDNDKSPFNFKEKVIIMGKMFGIPPSKIVQVANPYSPKEVLSKFDGKTTQYIAAVGEKDANRLQGKYFKPYNGKAGYGYDEIGYTYIVPPESNPISGTDVRRGLGGDEETAKKFFTKAYPKFDKDIFKMITKKLNEGFPGGIGVGLNLPNGYINGAPTGSVEESNNTNPSSEMRPEPHPTRHEIEYSNKDDYYDPIAEQIAKLVFEADNFIEEYFLEEEPNPIMDKEISYTSKDGKKKKITVRGALRLPKDHEAHIQAAKLVGPADAPVNEPKGKAATQAAKPAQPGQPVKKGQTAQGKVDGTSKGGEQNGQPAPPPEQKLSGAELKSSAETNPSDEKAKKVKKDLDNVRKELSKEDNDTIDKVNNPQSSERKGVMGNIKLGLQKFGKGLQDWAHHKKEMVGGTMDAVKAMANGQKIGSVKNKETGKWEYSDEKRKEQIHHIKHFAKDTALILGSMALGGAGVGVVNHMLGHAAHGVAHASIGGAALSGATGVFSHGAVGFGTHLLKDIAKHASLEAFGLKAHHAAGHGALLSTATMGLLEGIDNNNESNKFLSNFISKVVKSMETYKLSDEQLLQSIQQYQKDAPQRNAADLLKEDLAQKKSKAQTIGEFIKFATHRLELEKMPFNIQLVKDNEFATLYKSFGGYDPHSDNIYVYVTNRSLPDILRTLAHELVHLKQRQSGYIGGVEDGATGSDVENEANAAAGILLRDFGKLNSHIYEDVNVDVDKGDVVLMGKFKNKKVQVKDIGKDDHGMPTINGKQATTFRIPREERINEEQPHQREMIDGIVDMLNQVENMQNRKEMALDQLNNFKKEGIVVDETEFLNRCGLNSVNEKLSHSNLDSIEKYADRELSPADIEFSNHFFDRVNDTRNGKEISEPELTGFFKRLASKHKKEFLNLLDKYNQIVVKDSRSDINIPFVKMANKVIAKTIMRKGDFQTSSQTITNEAFTKGQLYKGTLKLGGNKVEVEVELVGADNKSNQFITKVIHIDKEYQHKLPIGSTLPIPARIFRFAGDWRKIKTPSAFKESLNEGLLLEGGAYGHMNHPFDISMNLTFGDLKKIINNALDGNLGVVREKTDGQALAISWKNGRLIAARNKGHLANSGENALDAAALADKFNGRGALADAYNFAMKDLYSAISGLGEKERQSIFKDGSAFCNLEVIYPENANVIPYGQNLLVFHNVVEYDEKGNAIGGVKGAESKLASMIKKVNADVQSKYTIQGPPITKLPKDEKLSSQKGKFNSMLSKLQSEFNLGDKDGVADYHYAWWMNFVNKSKKNLAQLEKEGLTRRWAFDNKSFTIKSIADEDARKWAEGVDKDAKDKIMKGNLRKFEDIFLGVGAEVLSFMGSVLTAQPDSALQSIRKSLESSISDIRSGGSESQIKRLEKELARLNAIGGFDKLVPNEGLVFFYKGNTYKLTGTFAPLNQILGIFKFGR
jgi:hypothetical protein